MRDITLIGYIFYILLSIIFLSACEPNEASEQQETYRLEKIDSFIINRDTRIRILDFNAVDKKYLAYDPITEEFLHLAENGDILETVSRFGEGPNEYSTNLITASFNTNGGYYVQSSNEFISYDQHWEVESRLLLTPYHTIILYSGPRIKTPFYHLQDSEEPYFFSNFFSGINVHHFDPKDDLRTKKLIELYNPIKGSLEWVLPFDPGLLPNSDFDLMPMMISQIYTLDDHGKLLYLTFQNSSVIGVYNLANNFELMEKIAFGHQEFTHTNKSKNIAIFNFSPKAIGVLYFAGMSEGAAQIKKDQDPDYLPYKDPDLYKIVLVQNGKWLKKELQFPKSSEPHSEILQLPNNRILLRELDPDDGEPEFSVYSIYELKVIPE